MPGDKIYITSKNGTQLTGSVLRCSEVKRSKVANTKELDLLFDHYCKGNATNDQNTIHRTGLSNLFRDFAVAAGSDSILSSAEIDKFLQENGLKGKVSTNSVLQFLKNVSDSSIINALYEDLDGMGTSSNFPDHLRSIPKSEMNNVLKNFKKEYGISLVQMIADEYGCLGRTRVGYLNIIRNKIMATKVSPHAEKYKAEFDKLVKDMDMTIFYKANAEKLSEFIEKNSYPRPQYPAPPKRTPAELETFNRTVIKQMMNKFGLCKIYANKDEVLERIMQYANLNNPRSMVEKYLNDSNPQVQKAAQNLLNSTFLDYFPLYVACIIAEESQFRETDSEVFSPNGKGVMQITKSLTDDIVERPDAFGKDFIKRLSAYGCNPKDSKSIYTAIQGADLKNVQMNYDVGIAGLRSKLATYFQQLKNGTYDSMKVDLTQPSVMLEMMARNYNANSEGKRDSKQQYVMSEVREVYARNVIERFRQYTPPEVFVRDYFQYNPKKEAYDIIID